MANRTSRLTANTFMRRSVRNALVLAVMLPLAGCGTSPEAPPGDAEKPTIALIMKSLANEFFKTMREGAEQYHQGHSEDFSLIVNGIKDERDLSRQVSLVEEMIAQQVDAIVIAPADSKALVPVLKRAQQAGIVVINIDNKLDAEVLSEAGVEIPFVGPDNRSGARKVGDHLAQRLAAGTPVAILEGVPTAFNAQQRKLGFEDAAEAAGWKVVDSQSGQWEMNLANTVATAMLSEHPEIKALLCSNDSMALGALAAVRTSGRDDVLVVGFDNITAIQEAIKNGSVVATADQHADQLAVFGIEYALQILEGAATPQDKETPVDLITADMLES
jgi:ribose transport system substrate-binding protein